MSDVFYKSVRPEATLQDVTGESIMSSHTQMHAQKTHGPTPFLQFLSGGVLFLRRGGSNDGPLRLLLGLHRAALDHRLGSTRQ